MVLESKQTTVAYRCPSCGSGVMSAVDAFKLSADMVKLKCTCGKSEMSMVRTNDGKIRFSVPCILCPKPHNFTVSTSLFFGKELFVLPCPYSDVNIAMMGDTNHVKAELSRTELQLLDMLEESGLQSFDSIHGESYLSDPQVLQIIEYTIKELDEEGKIFCKCPEGKQGSYELEFTNEGIVISCTECGATKTEAIAKLTPPATTEAITTEEVTTEVSVTTEDSTATTAETTTETANSDGCNASAALSAIAIMPMLAGGVLILRRRKED